MLPPTKGRHCNNRAKPLEEAVFPFWEPGTETGGGGSSRMSGINLFW